MPDIDAAIQSNERGMALRDIGDILGAESAYRAAIAAAPDWPAPIYNLGLLCKYERRWQDSFDHSRRAAELQPDDEASWWNLGIAATALANWTEARRAWIACGIDVPVGSGPLEFDWGLTPVRLNSDSDGEVVWAQRLDPARARIVNIPLPLSGFRWGDIVLNDGAVEGERVVDGRAYPVFNVLERLQLSPFRTFIIELATADTGALAALENCAEARGGAVENWGSYTSILCRDCSYGRAHQHSDAAGHAAHPHCGLVAGDHTQAEAIINDWLARTPTADLTVWYEAPAV